MTSSYLEELINELATVKVAVIDKEITLFIKARSTNIKALSLGCPLDFIMGIKNNYLCLGVIIYDITNAHTTIYKVLNKKSEYQAMLKLLQKKKFNICLFNELDANVLNLKANISLATAEKALDFLNDINLNTTITEDILRYIQFSFENRIAPLIHFPIKYIKYPNITNYYYDDNRQYEFNLNDYNEGSVLEKELTIALTSVFKKNLYPNPNYDTGNQKIELTDVLAFYEKGVFLIESKDTSFINKGYQLDKQTRVINLKRQLKTALNQLVRASLAVKAGNAIVKDKEIIKFNRHIPLHCIILITEFFEGDYTDINELYFDAIKKTGNFFHIMDLLEFIELLKASSSKPYVIDGFLILRWKM